jgi:hypothetical protein
MKLKSESLKEKLEDLRRGNFANPQDQTNFKIISGNYGMQQ